MRNLKTFYILLFAVSLALVWILLPFFSAIFWGTILAVLFQPLQRRLTMAFGNRPNIAALTTLALCVLIVILPVGLLVGTLAQEATFAYSQIKTGEWDFGLYFQKATHALPSIVQRWLADVGLGDVAGLQAKLADGAAMISQFMATQAVTIGQNTLRFAIGFGVMLYLVFFLLRDGIVISRRIRDAVPLDDAHKRKLLGRFATVVRATVKGNVAVATIQGLLGGLAFFVLGIKGVLLWGTLMAFLSLLPAIGSALVWVPVAVYFFLAGPLWKAIALLLFCTLVMGAVDNILRPILVGKDTRLPDWVVLISTLGGVSVFGINGFVIGPLIAALFVSCWDISVVDDSDERTIPERLKRLECEAEVSSQTFAEVSRTDSDSAIRETPCERSDGSRPGADAAHPFFPLPTDWAG
ncbi:AI-2E family transporter [Paraburkholderia terrae]|uniref:AI-2E family transporter n=1 Tax=Paraburkholderia terrae TaxID=311230 RepID=A0A2I8F5L0_9BURK|nr:AI-2E family transporter [Paraburkholderia terrae]AUT66354.1 AI-2E family transporter [Paraburkholderia terrae]